MGQDPGAGMREMQVRRVFIRMKQRLHIDRWAFVAWPFQCRGMGLALLLVGSLVLSHDVQAQATGVFSRLGFGARGFAMGNALVADAFGQTSPYYNPALAPFTPRQTLEGTVALMTLDREMQFLQFATPIKPSAGIAVGLIHAGVSNIDGRTSSGFHTGNLSTDEFAFFLAFGVRFGSRVTGGVGLQLFRTDLFEEVSAVNSLGLDLGLTIQATDALRLGIVADDLLARYSWDTSGLLGNDGKSTSDRFPTRLRVGAAYRLLDDRLSIVAEYESRVTSAENRTRGVRLIGDIPSEITDTERLRLQDNRLRIGSELMLSEIFAVRAGLDRLGSGAVGDTTPTVGFMVEQALGNLVTRIEYAFMLEPYAVGTMHLITLRAFL